MATALGIAPLSDGTGCDPLTHRRIIADRWVTTGVVCGLAVTGRSDLSYDVSAGCAVASRSDSDGCVELYYPGGTVATTANPSSSPRVDVVWVKANDAQQGDGDNSVIAGVTQGTPSASPTAPAAPAGCTVLSEHLVPAGATSTSAVTLNREGYRAIPYGASLGILMDKTYTVNDFVAVSSEVMVAAGSVNLPTARVVDFRMTFTMGGESQDGGSIYCIPRIDGQTVRRFEVALDPVRNATSQYLSYAVEVPEGQHNVTFSLISATVKRVRMWYSDEWAGQRFQLLDIGPAA